MLIRSRWTLEEYGDLVGYLLRAELRIIDAHEFEEQAPGVWLRHDVELSLGAAVAMAELENAMAVPSTYFVCVESPYFAGDEVGLEAAIERLLELERDVSFHLVLSPAAATVEDRLAGLAERFPAVEPRILTFHAPGVPSEALAAAPLGKTAYGQLVSGKCRYYSDSTGRWRWGDPRYADLTGTDVVQVLTHPFWWSGTYIAAELPLSEAAMFLPQLTCLKSSA